MAMSSRLTTRSDRIGEAKRVKELTPNVILFFIQAEDGIRDVAVTGVQTCALPIYFKYFFMRKLWFAQIAKALIVFPGGFGTMDELWEMLTLLQTGKLPKRNLILIYGRRYWDEVLNWKAMVRWGTIDESEYNLLQFADTVDEAFDRVRAGLEKYHMNVDSFLQAY